MANLIIAGVSGVGKSFLESLLSKDYGFKALDKYSTRPLRPGEKGLHSVSDKEFDKLEAQFFPVIHQGGYRYGYKKSEIIDQDKKTIATPMKDVEVFVNSIDQPLIPIILGVSEDNIDLLRERMRARENFDNLSQDQQQLVHNKIEERIRLALEDIGFMEHYENIARKYDGKVFYIQDDNTLFDEVIPYITEL